MAQLSIDTIGKKVLNSVLNKDEKAFKEVQRVVLADKTGEIVTKMLAEKGRGNIDYREGPTNPIEFIQMIRNGGSQLTLDKFIEEANDWMGPF